MKEINLCGCKTHIQYRTIHLLLFRFNIQNDQIMWARSQLFMGRFE